MKILFVTPPPYIPNRLHRMRSFDLIKILSKKHEVHLLSVTTEKKEPEEFAEIKKVCESIKIIYLNPLKAILNCLRFPFLPAEVAFCYSQEAIKEIDEIVKRRKIDIIYLKRLRSAIYWTQSKALFEKCHSEQDAESFSTKFAEKDPSARRFAPSVGMTTKVVIDTTDAMSMFYFRLYKQSVYPKKLFYLLEAIRYKRFEKTMMKKIKNWIVCSDTDKNYLEKIVNPIRHAEFASASRVRFEILNQVQNDIKREASIYVVSNAVDTEYFAPSMSKKYMFNDMPHSLLFRGLMDKPVNIDACLFFVKEILPKVQKNIKDVKLFIVGPKPHPLIKKLANGKDIFVTGFVKDVREFIGRTSISICPVRIGSGTRYKILQAWAFGKPVVSTTLGAEGLKVENGENIEIADTTDAFAKKIIMLFKNKKRYDTLARNGKQTVEKMYSLNVIAKKLESVLHDIQKQSYQ